MEYVFIVENKTEFWKNVLNVSNYKRKRTNVGYSRRIHKQQKCSASVTLNLLQLI